MDRAMRRRALLVGLAVAVPLTLVACGKRGAPVPPERRLPAAVGDLSGGMVGEGVRLTWTLPRVRMDRTPIKELRRVEVYRRLEEDGEPTAPSRPAVLSFGGLFGGPSALPGFERVADIALAEPKPPAEVSGGQVTYVDTQALTSGRRYTYVVVAVDPQGRPSPPSNRVAVAVIASPRAPTGLSAQAADREVHLSWTPPDTREDGEPIDGPLLYEVFRATTPEARPTRPLNPEPLTSPSFVDIGLQNDVTYHYSVRALSGPGGPASRRSDVVAATPEDTIAPAQPRGLVAVVAGTAIRLAWEAVGDADLAGYRVYRSATAGRGYQPLTPTPQPATTYVDADVRPGQTYYYVVTAVDRSRRANESVPSSEVSATVR
jgi:hypothetical protein